MAKRIEYKQISTIVAVGLAIMVALLIAGISVQQKVYRQARAKANEYGERIANNNFTIVRGRLNDYVRSLKLLESADRATLGNSAQFFKIMQGLFVADSSVVATWVRAKDAASQVAMKRTIHGLCNGIPTIEKGEVRTGFLFDSTAKRPLLLIYRSNNDGSRTYGVAVDLFVFQHGFRPIRELNSSYTTIVTPSRLTLYHPDESLIGKKDEEMKSLALNEGIVDTGIIQRDFFSPYLNMKLYRHTYADSLGDDRVLISINVPNLEFEEFLRKTQRNLLLLIVLPLLLLVLFIVMGIIVWKREFQRRQETEKNLLRLELQSEQQHKQMIASKLENLKSGVNPHFLFNSLGSLVALIKRDQQRAVAFTQSLSSQYRYLLETENRNVVELASEIAFTYNYVTIQTIRFGDGIQMQSDIHPQPGLGVPPLSIQTLVENCIKHNMSSTTSPLIVKLYHEGEYVVVANTLNPRTNVVESTGKGIDNLVKRYSYLSDRKCHFIVENGWYYAKVPLLKL